MFGIFSKGSRDGVDLLPKQCLELLHCKFTDMNTVACSLGRPIALRCLISSNSMSEDLDFISRIYRDEHPIPETNSCEWKLNDFIQLPADATVNMMLLTGNATPGHSSFSQTPSIPSVPGNNGTTTQPILIDDILFNVIAHRSICLVQLRKENAKLEEDAFDVSFTMNNMNTGAYGYSHSHPLSRMSMQDLGAVVRIRIQPLHATKPPKHHPVLGLHDTTHDKRALGKEKTEVHGVGNCPIGRLGIVVWKCKKMSTLQSTYITVTLTETPEFRQKSLVIEGAHNPVYDFSTDFEVSSLQSDIVICVHEASSRRILGRVVVPVVWFLDKMRVTEIIGANVKKTHRKQHRVQRDRARTLKPGMKARADSLSYEAKEDVGQAHYEFKHWFELYPAPPVTRWNRGGQYRPITTGMNFASGFGLPTLTEPIGFMKICVHLHLYEPLLLALVRNPMQHSQPVFPDNSTEESGGFQDMILAAHNMWCILLLLFDSPLMQSLNEVLHWKEVRISAIYLYVFGYMSLLAPMWQWPLFVTMQILALGMHRNMRNTLHREWKLFSDEKDASSIALHKDPAQEIHKDKVKHKETHNDKDKDEDDGNDKDKDKDAHDDHAELESTQDMDDPASEVPDSEGKESYAQQYRKFKSYAYRINKSTSETRSYLEKANNLFCWSDIVVSTMFLLVFLAISAGFMLMMVIMTPRQILFCTGLFLFTPPDIQESVIMIMMTSMNGVISFTLGFQNKKNKIQNEKRRKGQRLGGSVHDTGMRHNSLDNRMVELLQQFNAESTEVDFSDNSSDASDARDSDSDGESEEDDVQPEVNLAEPNPNVNIGGNTHEEKVYNNYGIISAASGSRTDQVCSAIYNIMSMAPDTYVRMCVRCDVCDVSRFILTDSLLSLPLPLQQDVCHRILCSRAKIADETTLPNKCFTLENSSHEYNFIIELLTAHWSMGSNLLAPPLVRQSFLIHSGKRIGDCPYLDEPSESRGLSLVTGKYSEPMNVSGKSFEHINASISSFMNQRMPSHVPSAAPRSIGLPERKKYQIHIELVSAKHLPFAHTYMPSLLTQKVYCDVAVMPAHACKHVYRTCGHKKVANPLFREEFFFKEIAPDATALVIAISVKAPSQYKKDAERIGYVVMSLEKLNKQTIQCLSDTVGNNAKADTGRKSATAASSGSTATSATISGMFGTPSGASSMLRSISTRKTENTINTKKKSELDIDHSSTVTTALEKSGDGSKVTISTMYPVLDEKWQPLTLKENGQHIPAMMLISARLSTVADA